jgi:hypothetical protein
MSIFELYLRLGFQHIADLRAYDHLVFIVALCAVYRPGQWRLVAVLVTAFTVGHSSTLLLATLGLIPVRPAVVEFLIPVTILLTAMFNMRQWRSGGGAADLRSTYAFPLIFGLIHGLGFSSYLRTLLGREASLVQPLFAFNVGLEIGQLLIVTAVMGAVSIATLGLRVPHRAWSLALSGAAAGISLILMARANPW